MLLQSSVASSCGATPIPNWPSMRVSRSRLPMPRSEMAKPSGQLFCVFVSILTRPGGRVLPPAGASGCRSSPSFNPHPARGPGAAFEEFVALVVSLDVSILTRPGGRVLLCSCRAVGPLILFQSSPGPGAGCCSSQSVAPALSVNAFQSSPGPGAGCCVRVVGAVGGHLSVSILTRPGGRVLHATPPAASDGIRLFQSSPGPGAGCCAIAGPSSSTRAAAFQSSPGPGAGCCRRH